MADESRPSGGNKLDVRVTPDGTRKGVCNLIIFSQFSVPDSRNKKALSLNEGSYENAFAIDLALKHLNERNGSIIKDIEKLDGTCDIEFVGEYIDTEDDAVTAAKRVTNRIEATEIDGDKPNRYEYSPCALIGATSSFSESIQTSVVANMKGYSVVSGMNHGTILDHDKNFPRFARTIPSNAGPAKAFVRYVNDELAYEGNYLVILRASTDHSNDYVSSIYDAIRDYDSVTFIVRELFIQQDGSNIAEQIKRLKEYRITTVIAIFEGVEYKSNLYDTVMKEAIEQKVAGDGHHVWFFPESLLEYSFYIQNLRNPQDFRESPLFHAYRGAGIVKSGRLGSKYVQLTDGIKEQAESPEYIDYIQSILPNPFSDTNNNATRDLMNDESFLNGNYFDSRIQFLYEAIVLVGLSACVASTDDLYLLEDDLHKTLVRYNYTGISGPVTLDSSSGSRIIDSTDYSIMNIQAITGWNDSKTADDFRIEFRHTATMTEKGLVHVAPFVYNDGATTPPISASRAQLEIVNAHTVVFAVTSIFCVVSIAISVVSAIWTYQNRNTRIIRASQSFFLYLLCIGTIFIALSMIPLITVASMEMNHFQGKICANVTTWFLFLGFSIIISSFYSKLNRINKIMDSSKGFKRVTITVRDAIFPVIVTVSVNVLILSLMTSLNPPGISPSVVAVDQFERQTKVYQRITTSWSYVVPLIVVNVGIFFLAMYEAWRARLLSTEFQENESIMRSLLFLTFGGFICVPVLLVSNDVTIRLFLVSTLVTILCISVQVFLFGEKYRYQKKYMATNKPNDVIKISEPSETEEEQLLSNKGRYQLALENKKLRKQMSKQNLEVGELKERLSVFKMNDIGGIDLKREDGDELENLDRISNPDSVSESVKDVRNIRLYSR